VLGEEVAVVVDVDLMEAEAGFANEMGTGGDAFDQGCEGFGGGFLFEGEREKIGRAHV
jgi:hypothetical protein